MSTVVGKAGSNERIEPGRNGTIVALQGPGTRERDVRRVRPPGVMAAVGGAPAIGVAVVLISLAAAVDPAGARPFTSVRWAVVSTAIGATALCVRRWALPRWHGAAWLLVIGGMTAGALAGPDTTTAWLGHPQRHLGVFAWILFALAAATGAALSDRRRLARTLEMVAVVVGGNLVVTSMADRLGWDPAGASFPDGRIGGVFGQPVVLGAVCVLLLPVVVGCRRVGVVRWPIAGGLVLTIALSQTRGAVLGLVAVAVVTAPTWWRTLRSLVAARPRSGPARGNQDGPGPDQNEDGRSRWPAVVTGLAVLVLLAAVAISPLGDRLIDTGDSSRPDEWALGVAVVADHPLVGVGPEGYRIAVLEHLDDDYVDAYGRDVVIDRAHSAPLDVAVSGGAMAGVAYLALISSVAVATWRRQRSGDRPDPLTVAAGAGAVGVFASGLVAFPVPEVDTVAWLFAGLVLATDPGRVRLGGRIGWPVVAGLAVAVAVVAGATDVAADRHMNDALTAAVDGRTEAAVRAAERAVDLRPDLVDAHYVAATVAATGPTILDIDRALTAAEEGLERFGHDPALRDRYVNLLVDRAVRSGLANDVTAAVVAIDDLAGSDPTSLVVESGTDRLIEACLIRCENKP